MQKEPLFLKFRGERDYLQGADLYKAICDAGSSHIGNDRSTFVFQSFLRRQPDVVWSGKPLVQLRDHECFRGEASFISPDSERYAILLESDREVEERVECCEKEVVENAIIDVDTKCATLRYPSIVHTIDMIVFLNKQLHFATLPHVKEKWLFVRLDLPRLLPFKGAERLELKLQKNLADRLTQTGIFIDDVSYGVITFSTLK